MRILRKYKYPPDQQDAAVEMLQQQAKAVGGLGLREPSFIHANADDNAPHARDDLFFSIALLAALA